MFSWTNLSPLLQDLLALRSQMGGQVNVEVDAAPQEDLSTVMAGIRDHYETVANKNRRDLEAWFQAKASGIDVYPMSTTVLLYYDKMSNTSKFIWHHPVVDNGVTVQDS